MSQLTLRTELSSRQGGETPAFSIAGWIGALWQGACRVAERPGRFVPYC